MHVRGVTVPPAEFSDAAQHLFIAAAEAGDGDGGIPYTVDWDGRVVVGARMHWVLCEAIAAATVLFAATGNDRYEIYADDWRELGERFFADPATGSWHHELTPTGEVGRGTWEGQPDAYHLAQMLLLAGRPVRGGVAAALR
jgi:mannose/cellobiose epimerase-like protein (N-acyl-D-glucosamine 2-epimerase family)